MVKNHKGFTLIEIIAVLVILGILAVIAIPRFVDLQNDANRAAAQGGVAAAQSAISIAYASHLLGNNTVSGPAAACAGIVIDIPTGASFNIVCTGNSWNEHSLITSTYNGAVATGNWINPSL